MVRDADLVALIDAIYAAGTNAGRWPVLLERLGGLFRAHIAALFVQDLATPGGAFSFSHGLAPEWQRLYRDYYAARNPWMILGGDLQQVRTSEERYPTSELVKTEFHAGFLRGIEVSHGVGGTIFRDGSLTANITVFRKREEFGAHGRKVISALIPHLRRALRTYRRLAASGLEQQAILAALDHLSCGVLLVDPHARAIFVNAEARRIVAARDGLSLERDGVAAARVADTRALRGLIARAAVPAGGGGALVLGRPSARRPLGIEVVPLVISENDQASPHVVGMFVVDPDREHESDDRLLARLYALTPAEAGLAARLASGDSLQDAARQRRIRHETARTHLKRILHKTGTRRQSELLLQLRRGPLSVVTART